MKKYRILSVILAMLAVLAGCGSPDKTETGVPAGTAEAASEPKLCFSVVYSENMEPTVISPEELGTALDMTYFGISQVNVRMEGSDIPLPEAIRDGKLTVPELYAFARMDARNGLCEETFSSVRGLTHFTYTYPAFQLLLAYDVYETPDGRQTLIEEVYIYHPSHDISNSNHFYVDKESEWGYFLDREDWGLSFETATTSPTGITLNYTQQGGQQLGDLLVDGYLLYTIEGGSESKVPGEYVGMSGLDTEGLPIPLAENSSGQVTIDWSSVCGTLSPGRYFMRLYVTDIYEESDIHPLMTNFHDRQGYAMVFAIE